MKFILALGLLPFLYGCGGMDRVLIPQKEQIVVLPPESEFRKCPEQFSEPPHGEYLQSEVAIYITQLYADADRCRSALKNVEQFLKEAKRIVEER
jgi:hypothetical protein